MLGFFVAIQLHTKLFKQEAAVQTKCAKSSLILHGTILLSWQIGTKHGYRENKL